MVKKVAFILDTGSSYNLDESDCFIIPIVINVMEQNQEVSYFDGQNISREELIEFLNAKKKVSTSKPILGYIYEQLDKLFQTYDMVISIPIAKALSSTYDTWLVLQKEYGQDKLLVADANGMSVTGHWLVQDLKEHFKHCDSFSQKDLDIICDKHKQNTCGTVIVNDLNQLINGGRLKPLKGLIAKLLKLALIIKYKGKLEYLDKSKTIDGAIRKAIDAIDADNHFKTKGIKHIAIFADLKDKHINEMMVQYIKELINTNIEYTEGLLPGCVIMHTGADTISIMIEAKE